MNPRAAINDLLPFQGSPFGQLGYFSKLPYAIASHFFQKRFILYRVVFHLSRTFLNYFHSQQRREWDSNPRALADKRFSRPPRYDHFDISPYFRRFSLSAQVIFYHLISELSTTNLKFFYFLFSHFSKLQKCLCNPKIFRCGNLNILIRSFCQSYFYPRLLFDNHGIIRNITHIFPANLVMGSFN